MRRKQKKVNKLYDSKLIIDELFLFRLTSCPLHFVEFFDALKAEFNVVSVCASTIESLIEADVDVTKVVFNRASLLVGTGCGLMASPEKFFILLFITAELMSPMLLNSVVLLMISMLTNIRSKLTTALNNDLNRKRMSANSNGKKTKTSSNARKNVNK